VATPRQKRHAKRSSGLHHHQPARRRELLEMELCELLVDAANPRFGGRGCKASLLLGASPMIGKVVCSIHHGPLITE
jgi:hypothetical protein